MTPSARASDAVDRLAERLGQRVSTNPSVRAHHAGPDPRPDAPIPDAVVSATCEADVVQTLRACRELGLPVIAHGLGSSLERQLEPVHGGVALALAGMNRIVAVDAASLDCRVEAGVRVSDLNAALRADGLFFPVDPGADPTLGGMAATGASGTMTVRYGAMRELTLGLTVVTADGRVVRTGSRARKASVGFDLTRLFLGSEGTLGVITELQLRLFGLPEQVAAATCQFPSDRQAIEAVVLMLQHGVPLARIEFMDALQTRACIAHSDLTELEPRPTLCLEFHGDADSVTAQILQVATIVEASGGGRYVWAKRPEERSRLWKARHHAYYAALRLRPRCRGLATDACVPISELGACIAFAREEADRRGLIAPITGHVGDGNFHALALYKPSDRREAAAAEAFAEAVAREAIRRGGACSGEHGVGLHRIGLMAEQHGEGLALMRLVKGALDPDDLLNPGKIIPAPGSDRAPEAARVA